MIEGETLPKLSMLGGPLHRLGSRLGLVRAGTNTVRLGVALGLLAWGVLFFLALLRGYRPKMFSLAVIAVHVRLLVAIPLFFLCETWVVPQMAEFTRNISRSGLVSEASLPSLASTIRGICRMKDSWLAEALLLLAAFAFPIIELVNPLPAGSGSWVSVLQAGGGITWLNGWYLGFCLPLVRFLILRWVWRMGLWWHFLWRLHKLKLHLIPTHSDGAAGLGYLEIVQEHFAPLAMALSSIFAAQCAEDISFGTVAFETLRPLALLLLLLVAGLFIGPIFLFSRKLWICRATGLSEYMGMASRYVNAFDRKWIRGENPSGEPLLGTPDMQSLADLSNSLNMVRELRWFPAGQRLFAVLAASTILPLLPLLLLKYPIEQLAAQLVQMMTGL